MASSISRILVFGGSGQLGLDLARISAKRGVELRALSRSQADITDLSGVTSAIGDFKPSLVVNAAAYTKVDDAEVEREAAERANITGPRVLAQACDAAGVPLLHISSDYVFDGTKSGAYVESDPVAPIGFYGSTKAQGEDAVRAAQKRHIILRVSWLYGEYGNNFLKTVLRLASQRDEIGVVADQHGCPTSTRDLANAIFRVSERIAAREDLFGTYHFAGDGITTWYGFASAAIGKYNELAAGAVRVKAITTADYPTRTKRPVNSALDCTKFERSFGFRGQPWRTEVEEISEILLRQKPAAGLGTVS
jgi:dTDP-4-dehydrorhamnose reductase